MESDAKIAFKYNGKQNELAFLWANGTVEVDTDTSVKYQRQLFQADWSTIDTFTTTGMVECFLGGANAKQYFTYSQQRH